MFTDSPSEIGETPSEAEPVTLSRSQPEQPNNLETATELRLEETTAENGGTIIPSVPTHFDRNDKVENGIGIQKFQPHLDKAANSDETLMDLIIWAVHGVFGFFLSTSSNGDENVAVVFMTEEDIDNLAVFQGSVADFVELHEGQVAPKKIEKMKSMLMDDWHIEWERRCRQLMSTSIYNHPNIRDLESHRSKLKAFLGSWNPSMENCSENVYLLEDQMTAHRIPMVNQTDAVRSKLGVMSGIHAWDMKVIGPIGTHFSVGVATENAPLRSRAGYMSLVGDEDESWGWDVVWGNVSHKGRFIGNYPGSFQYQYTPGDIIRLILDCERGCMSFAVNEMSFGVAFNNLPANNPMFPTVGMVYGNMEVSLIYLGKPPPLRN